jgi:hypothetical protein
VEDDAVLCHPSAVICYSEIPYRGKRRTMTIDVRRTESQSEIGATWTMHPFLPPAYCVPRARAIQVNTVYARYATLRRPLESKARHVDTWSNGRSTLSARLIANRASPD